MRSIFGVMSLKLANISFPSKVMVVDKWNRSIWFITWDMFMMGIKSLRWNSISRCNFWLSFHFNLCFRFSFNLNVWVNHKISCIRWFVWLFLFASHDLVLGCNYSNFNWIWISLYLNSFFHIVMSFLLTPKACNWMLCHRSWMSSFAWHILYKSNHCFVTPSIKLDIIASFKRQKFFSSIFSWIFWDLWLNWIFEIS